MASPKTKWESFIFWYLMVTFSAFRTKGLTFPFCKFGGRGTNYVISCLHGMFFSCPQLHKADCYVIYISNHIISFFEKTPPIRQSKLVTKHSPANHPSSVLLTQLCMNVCTFPAVLIIPHGSRTLVFLFPHHFWSWK